MALVFRQSFGRILRCQRSFKSSAYGLASFQKIDAHYCLFSKEQYYFPTYSSLMKYPLTLSLIPRTLCTQATQVDKKLDDEEPDALYRRLFVEVKGHEPAVINSYQQFVTMVCEELGIQLIEVSAPPRVHDRKTLLKSVHIYKKHRVQYEIRTHYRLFEIKHITGSTADTFLEYIQRNLPEGMAMKVTKHQLTTLPENLKPPVTSG